MAKASKRLDELFHDTLKDIYFAEKKILTALPKMAKAAQDQKLRAAFEKHELETETQVSRLEQVFKAIDAKPQGKTCDAIIGLIEEGQEIMVDYKGSPALDAGLVSAAQAVEHYEISRYGTLRAWAKELGLSAAVKLLEATLREEKATDEADRNRRDGCESGSAGGLSSRRKARSGNCDASVRKRLACMRALFSSFTGRAIEVPHRLGFWPTRWSHCRSRSVPGSQPLLTAMIGLAIARALLRLTAPSAPRSGDRCAAWGRVVEKTAPRSGDRLR